MKLGTRFELNREKIIAAVFAVGMSILAMLDHSYFHNVLLTGLWLVVAVLISVVLLVIMLVAGFAVFRAVVKASAGFTILIFLAQTYCGLPSATPEGIQALTFLWGASFLYILFEFAKEFQEACKENLKKLGEDRKRWEGKLTIGLFLLFAVVYIVALYQVLNPILHDLCIYK